MKIRINNDIFEKIPDLFQIVLIIKGFNNKPSDEIKNEIIKFLRQQETVFRERIADESALMEAPTMKPYLEAFEKFGANIKKVRPTHLGLALRVLEGSAIPSINPIVDLYNAVSLKHLIPFGGEDLSKVYGDMELTFATGNEQWIALGAEKSKSPKQGELVWRDDYDVLTRGWNWRQCERTKLTEEAINGYFIIDGLSNSVSTQVKEAAHEFEMKFKQYFGGDIQVLVLDKNNLAEEVVYETQNAPQRELISKAQGASSKHSTKKTIQEKKFEYGDSLEGKLQEITYTAIIQFLPSDITLDKHDIEIQTPSDPSHGDLATNVAMILAGSLRKSPIEIADSIKAIIQYPVSNIQSVEVVRPGFINFRISPNYYKTVLNEILEQGEKYGTSNKHSGETYLVEHTSPNPTGDLHLGHWKNNVTGLALTYLFEAVGIHVTRDAIDNNRGIAIMRLMWGYLKFGRKDGAENKIDLAYWSEHKDEWHTPGSHEETQIRLLSKLYTKGSHDFKENLETQEAVRQMLRDWESEDALTWELWKQTQQWIWEGYERALSRIGGWKFDKIWHEHEIYKTGREHALRGVEEGVFKKLPDGAIVTDLKKDFGLTDTILVRNDGTTLYITQDLELTKLKKKTFNPDQMFWVIGPEQDLQMKQAFACASQLGFGAYEDFHHIAYGFIFLRDENGKQIKMSKRLGNLVYVDDLVDQAKEHLKSYVTSQDLLGDELNDVLEKTAIGAIKYSLLRTNRLKDQVFDFDTMLSFEGDSGPYLMYTYARCRSMLRKSESENVGISEYNNVLSEHSELDVLKTLKRFPSVVLQAAEKFETHIVPNYLFDLAQVYNNFYNALSVLNADTIENKQARLTMTAAVAQVLKNGLALLGINTVEKM